MTDPCQPWQITLKKKDILTFNSQKLQVEKLHAYRIDQRETLKGMDGNVEVHLQAEMA